jgi:hypothetical protein
MRRNATLYTYWTLFMQFVLGITVAGITPARVKRLERDEIRA